MESALLLAKHGATGYFGVPTGSGTGVEHLREALRRYPREDFSSDFAQRLGMFFYERSEFDKASEEFARVLDQYGDGPDAVLALYMLGRCAEARFDALDYDSRSLKDARRHYERFLDETEKMKRLPEPAAGWVERLLPAVRERLGSVYERLLSKRLQVADYYEWKGLPKSARLSYAAIVREEASFRKILPSLAETPAVVQARKRLAEIKP
jgi:outer membrane protein assembly factor BamD (BamD/ComL family)